MCLNMLSIVCALVCHPTISIWSLLCQSDRSYTVFNMYRTNLSLSYITNNSLSISGSVRLWGVGSEGGSVDPYLDFLMRKLSVRRERWRGRLSAR